MHEVVFGQQSGVVRSTGATHVLGGTLRWCSVRGV